VCVALELFLATTPMAVRLILASLPVATTACLIMTFVMATATATASLGTEDANTGASVNILNYLNESVVIHCQSKESDLYQKAVGPGLNYYWQFHPNVFGRTVYNCEFLWRTKRQDFDVWKGSYYDDRPPCSTKGACSYKIAPNGFYYALESEGDQPPGTNLGIAESWEFYKPWLPNPSSV
jgi:hypothetical protein